MALTRTVTGIVVAVPVVVGALAYCGLEEAAKKIKEVKTKKRRTNTKCRDYEQNERKIEC